MSIWPVLTATIILSAFFSGMEISFVSSNRLRIEIGRKQNSFTSRAIARFIANPGQFIVTMLIGNNIALVIYGLLTARILEPRLSEFISSEPLLMLTQILISTLVIVVLAEFLPKGLFRMSPNLWLRNLSLPASFFYFIFYPVSIIIVGFSNLLLRIFFGVKIRNIDSGEIFSRLDLDNLINESRESESADRLEDHDIKIFQKALDLSNVKLRACMIPRTEIIALPVSSSVEDVRQAFIETGHSNILVYEESIDNITGYFRLRDLFSSPPDIKSVIRKLPIVPESMAANKLLRIFVEENKKIALVVDEFGGTSGLVTIEDILEEIVGDIEDEHDSNGLTEKKIGDGEWLFSGRLDIDYINEVYGLSLPETEEYETLAGLLLHHFESIPKINQVTEIGHYTIRVLKVSGTRIELINIKRRGNSDRIA
jgi:CBS domain containing-hemolysin-like protein